jgi:hypothetical protein
VPSVYDLYGVGYDDLEEARAALEHALALRFVAHESSYLGEYYRQQGMGEEEFVLRRNHDPIDDEWAEPDSRAYAFLLYVDRTPRSDEVHRKLAVLDRVALLKHDVV